MKAPSKGPRRVSFFDRRASPSVELSAKNPVGRGSPYTADFTASDLGTIANPPDPTAQTFRDHVSGNPDEGDTVNGYLAKGGHSGVMGGAAETWAAVRLHLGIRIIVRICFFIFV